MKKFLKGIDKINEWIGKADSYLILVLIIIIVYEVFMRYVVNRPTSWVHEGSAMLFGIYIILSGGYTELQRSHVSMDLFYNKLGYRKRALVDVITFVLVLVFCIVLIWKGFERAMYAIQNNERSKTLWAPSLIPIKVVLPIGGILLLIQSVATFIRNLLILVGGEKYLEY